MTRGTPLFLLLPAFVFSGCLLFFDTGDDPVDTPSLGTLRNAHLAVEVDGRDLILTTVMWRDFMPVSPPDGKPLIAIFKVVTADSSDFPDSVQIIAGFVVDGDDVWATRFTGEEPAPADDHPFQRVETARNGPEFGPDILVDAVVRLEDSAGQHYLLRAENEYIGATY